MTTFRSQAVFTGLLWGILSTDVFEVRSKDRSITYWKNSNLFYRSCVAIVSALRGRRNCA